MIESNCSELYELEISPDLASEEYQNDYIDAHIACHPEELDALINAQRSGEDPSSIAKIIAKDMSEAAQSSHTGLEEKILNKLVQLDQSRAPIHPDLPKDFKSDKGADPVMLYKGQFIHDVEDIRINGAGIDFVFNRSYRNQVIFNGPLGFNWTHNFHVWLRVGDQVIFRSTGDLREEPFTKHPKFDEGFTDDFDYWIPPDGQHGVIFAENNSFVLRQPNGSRQIFEPDPSHSFLHRLSRIKDRFGNYLKLHYDADERLAQVEINHPQRLVAFEYDAQARICSIRDYTGRQWGYAYDSLGDLIAVTSSATDRYDCGLTVCYDYSSAFHTGELQHNLIRIIDAAGQIYLETEYGTSRGLLNFNRVVRQRQGGGEYRFEYQDIDQVFDAEYPDEQRPAHQTFLVERNGQVVCHMYNKFGNLLRREQSVIENGLPRTLTEQYRYNRDANVVASLSPEGVLTQHLFGRDYFVLEHPLTANGDVPTDSLTWKERQAFGRIRTTVRRGGYASFASFSLTQRIWGNFPDILGGLFPATMPHRDQDIIIKMTYEDEFGQLLSISDPRYTNSPDPNAITEHQLHQTTLTEYDYDGPANDPNLFLVQIKRPLPTLPDGTQGAEIVEEFRNIDGTPGYDNRGRLLRSINSVRVVTELSYFDDANELSLGHLRQVIVDVGGFEITMRNEVDELGRVTAVHLPKSVNATNGRFVTRTMYNNLDQVIETTSSAPFNFQTRRFYDRTGKLEREEGDLRDESGQPELGGSAVATFCYDEEFNLAEATVGGLDLAAHLVTKHCYDSAGKRTLTILPNGNQMRIRYDERQLPVAQIAGAGSEDAATVRTDYDGDGRVRRTFDARGNPTTLDFDVFGRVISAENALGHITRTNYDKASNVTCVRVFEKRDAGYFLLARSETEYDELNRAIRSGVSRFDNPLGPFNLAQLAEVHLNSPGPGDLLETQTFYDAQGRIDHTVDSHPLRRETHFEYDNLDRLVTVTDPLGNKTLIQYDAHNNVIRTDQMDRVLAADGTEIGQRFFASSSTYDELDRLSSSTDSLGNTRRVFYDSRGNAVRQIDPLRNELQTAFDIFNRPITSTRFLTSTGLGPVTAGAVPVTTSQEYDRNSNLSTVIDALGRHTRYQYDALDRRRAVIYPDESQTVIDYDADGNVIRTQDNNGLQRFYTVDALSRITRVDVDKSGLPADLIDDIAGATFEQYAYDGLDRQTVAENDFAICRYRFNSLSWPLAETIQFTVNEAPLKTPFVISRVFDDVGAVVELTYPNGRKLQLDRDELNRLIKIQNLSNGTSYPGHASSPAVRPITQMTYAGQQRNQCLAANGASTSYRHDGAGRLIEIAHASPNGPLLAIQYLYDAASNVRARNDVLPTVQHTERFAYDSLYRLGHELPDTNESFDFSNFSPSTIQLANPLPDGQSAINAMIGSMALPQTLSTYDYDLVGNREIERPEVGGDIHYSSNNPLDQYTSRDGINFIHDANGNLKKEGQRKYTYDSLNRLVTVKQTGGQEKEIAQYWHDASGRRILERAAEAGTITQLIHDGDDIVSEYRNGTLLAQYVFDDGIDRPLQIAAQEKEHWYHADLVGSIRLLTDANGDSPAGYRYTAFGKLTASTGNDMFNPWRYTARRFDVDLETYDYRARQYDPKIGRFLQRDPAEMVDGTNLFTYSINSPLAMADPSGTESRPESQNTLETRKTEIDEILEGMYSRAHFKRIISDEKCFEKPDLYLGDYLISNPSIEHQKIVADRIRASMNSGQSFNPPTLDATPQSILTPENEIIWADSERYEHYRGPGKFIPLDVMHTYQTLTSVDYSRGDIISFAFFNGSRARGDKFSRSVAAGEVGKALFGMLNTHGGATSGSTLDTLSPAGRRGHPNDSTKAIQKEIESSARVNNMLSAPVKNSFWKRPSGIGNKSLGRKIRDLGNSVEHDLNFIKTLKEP